MKPSAEDPIRVLFLAAEADPFVKVGGLADYAGSLPRALSQLSPAITKQRKLEVRLAIPDHGLIDHKKWGIKHLLDFNIREKGKPTMARAYTATIQGVPVYFIGRKSRENNKQPVYLPEDKFNGRKFGFFSIAAFELLKILDWPADILHANDWHTSFSVIKLAQEKEKDPFYKKTRSLLTIHNLAYMGGGSEKVLENHQLNPVDDPHLPPWAHNQPLPMAIALADAIVAVSPSYAQEIKTPQFGYGLEKMLQQRGKSVSGILNGIDHQRWNPSTDACITEQYSVDSLETRKANKRHLQDKFGLPTAGQEIPLFTIISRLDFQKGIDLLIDGFELLKGLSFQLIILGSGSPTLENQCRQLEERYPRQVRAQLKFDPQLANQLYGGADMILIPSRFEPCGWTQLIAMRYGCLAVARATGGLKDSIKDGVNGFLFNDLTSSALAAAIKRAIGTYHKKSLWNKMQVSAMNSDYSWGKSASAYAKLYQKLLDEDRR